MSEIVLAGPVAYLTGSSSSVFFAVSGNGNAAANSGKPEGTSLQVRQLQNALDIVYWGEDNRFPQNIENQMRFCGIGKAALAWRAQMLFGDGIMPGKVTGIGTNGEDIFEPLDRTKYKKVYDFIGTQEFFLFMLEYLLDWSWYENCFPEVILSNDCTEITGLVHQESCDARFENMDDNGVVNNVYLSKLWGASKNQYAQFDPERRMKGLLDNPEVLTDAYAKYIKKLPCIDKYNAVASLTTIAEKLKKKASGSLKSAILPVSYPSPNKTFYQVPAWDGARLGGWIEIACKIPAMLKVVYNKAFSIKYHIEVPESYFERKYGFEKWHSMKTEEQTFAKKELLTSMDEFLSGDPNAHKAFISFFEVDNNTKQDYARIKITQIEDKSSFDKELLSGSAADIQMLIAMQVHPTLFGAGTIGTGQQRSGGSDIREAFLVYNALLKLPRRVLLQPLYLVRDYNKWGNDIEFKIRDIVLTTLDTGAGTKKVIS